MLFESMSFPFKDALHSARVIGMPKCSVACNYCKAKKIRCESQPKLERSEFHLIDNAMRIGNGGRPCSNCRDHNEECIITQRQRTKRKAVHTPQSRQHDVIAQRIARLEFLVGADRSQTPSASQSVELEFQDTMYHSMVDDKRSDHGSYLVRSPSVQPVLHGEEGDSRPVQNSQSLQIYAITQPIVEDEPSDHAVMSATHTAENRLDCSTQPFGQICSSPVVDCSPDAMPHDNGHEREDPPPGHHTGPTQGSVSATDSKQEVNSVYAREVVCVPLCS